MATSFSLTGYNSMYDGRYLRLTCTQTPKPGLGKSTINWTLTVAGGSYEWYTTGATTVKIGSKTVYYKARTSYEVGTFPVAKGSTSGSFDVDHDANGNLSLACSISTAIYYSAVKTDSNTWSLNNVPRKASITSGPDTFTDEENPTIYYSNPAGSTVTTLQACIGSTDGKTIHVPYKDITKTGTNYQFQLTDTERQVLRAASSTSSTKDLKFYVKTIVGENTPQYSEWPTKLKIVNALPTMNPTVTDVGSVSIQLTGDANVVIKGYNNMQFAFNETVKKEATVKSRSVVCGGMSSTASSGKLNYVESGTFIFSLTDSRNNPVTQTITKTLVDYVPLTCTLDAKNPTADGDMTLIIKGNYFNDKFGPGTNALTNALTVQYAIKTNDGSYGSWTPVTPTKSGNTYSATIQLTGLDYQSTYTIQARAIDTYRIKSSGSDAYITTGEKKFKTTPIFDWSDEDFAFNVPISAPQLDATNISGAYVRQNGLKVVGYNGEVSNFNTALTTGYYYVGYTGEGLTGAPYTGNTYGVLEVRVTPGETWNKTNNWIWQKYTDTNGKQFMRHAQNANDFTAWARIPNKFDDIYPVGSVVMTNTNKNPSSDFGGTWSLIDKGFNPGKISNPFTYNTTNISSATVNVHRSDHSITFTGTFGNKVAFTDSTQDIGQFNLSSIGITQFPEAMRFVGYSDGGNSMIQMVMGAGGDIEKIDTEYNITSVAAGNTWYFSFTVVIDDSAMLDAACTRFYWKRTA